MSSRAWSRPMRFDVDIVHLLMGLAMAGMFVAALDPLPPGVWEVVFSGVAAWSLWRCGAYVTRRHGRRVPDDHVHHVSHYPTHVVMAFAMLYMYLAMPAKGATVGAMAGSGATGTTADFVGLPLLFLFVLLGSGVWELDRAERFTRVPVVRDPLLPAPELAPAAASAAAINSLGIASEPRDNGTYARERKGHERLAARWESHRRLARTRPRGGVAHRHVHRHGLHARGHVVMAGGRVPG